MMLPGRHFEGQNTRALIERRPAHQTFASSIHRNFGHHMVTQTLHRHLCLAAEIRTDFSFNETTPPGAMID
ncbi:hypothetical protein PsorP6_003268 [Peronosclerospora sorghi]|uniref:Uncharacterized protein n=1 Tax=Peronosclerospora sorghi TaxID=230839 RepID=A0ACC0VSX1_9STRA|nr:hypothetical protein PsorP6_003268 [Peronosclerospora sorghi]